MRLPRAYLLVAAAGVVGLLLGLVDAVALPVATGAACAAAVGSLISARRSGAAASTARRARDAVGSDVERHSTLVRAAMKEQGQATRHAVNRIPRQVSIAVRRDVRASFAQTEATIGLHGLLRPRAAMPPSRGWAASPDAALELVRVVLRDRPRLVVECGSGLSSLWLGYALELVGEDGRVVSLEHDAPYAEALRARVREHGLDGRVEVRDAPLVTTTFEGQEVVWYDPAALHGLDGIGLLFVDGPPATTGHHARWPAVPLLADRMAAGGRVVLDDLIRDEEKEILALWQEHRPSWTVESLLQHEKGSGVMTVGEGQP